MSQIYSFANEKSNLFKMSEDIRLNKGLDIQLIGEADKVYASVERAKTYEVKPTDFYGLIPNSPGF